jgi:hypothetical protein
MHGGEVSVANNIQPSWPGWPSEVAKCRWRLRRTGRAWLELFRRLVSLVLDSLTIAIILIVAFHCVACVVSIVPCVRRQIRCRGQLPTKVGAVRAKFRPRSDRAGGCCAKY